MTPIIEARGIAKYYPKGIKIFYPDIILNNGDFLKVRGVNGSGKSTLLKILGNVISPDLGVINRAYKLSAAFVPQEGGMNPNLTVAENMVLKRFLYRRDDHDSHIFLLESFGIEELKNKKIRNLSVGYRKLISIISSLAINPELLILDEPFAGLHETYKSKLVHVLQSLKSRNQTIVISTHENDLLSNIGRTLELTK